MQQNDTFDYNKRDKLHGYSSARRFCICYKFYAPNLSCFILTAVQIARRLECFSLFTSFISMVSNHDRAFLGNASQRATQ